MNEKDIKSAIESVGIPCAHMSWVRGSAPELPWAVFYLDDTDGFFADDGIYSGVHNWIVELAQRSSDKTLEENLENVIVTEFGPFSKSEYWDSQENCLITSYSFSLLDNQEQELNNAY